MTNAHWALGDRAGILGIATLTRYTNLAANSDKYRRFIVMWKVGSPANHKMLITHTGRWTAATARGDWSGGVYKVQIVTPSLRDNRLSAVEFLAKHVQRKLGSYTPVGLWGAGMDTADCAMSPTDISIALNAVANSEALNPAASSTPPSAGVDLTKRLVSAVASPSNDGVVPAVSTPLPDRVAWLLRVSTARERDTGLDEFELLSAYADINQAVAQEQARLTTVTDELKLSLANIVGDVRNGGHR